MSPEIPEGTTVPRLAAEPVVGDELVSLVLTGGFPEMLFRVDEGRRQAWARDYLKTLLRRDIGDIAEVEKQVGTKLMSWWRASRDSPWESR